MMIDFGGHINIILIDDRLKLSSNDFWIYEWWWCEILQNILSIRLLYGVTFIDCYTSSSLWSFCFVSFLFSNNFCLFFVWWFFFGDYFFYWFLEFFVHKWIQSLESLCKQIFFQWQPNVFQIRKFIRNLFLFIYFHLENKSIRTINVIWKRKTIFRKNHQVNINLLFFCCCCLMILSKKMVKWISIHFLVIEMKNLKLNKCAKKQNSMKIFPLSLSHFLFDPNFWMDPIYLW